MGIMHLLKADKEDILEQGFVDILKQLVAEQTNAALTDAKRCKALLVDYTKNEYKKESRLLIQAVEAGVAKAIDGTDELEPCKKARIRELEEKQSFNSTAAADIVNTSRRFCAEIQCDRLHALYSGRTASFVNARSVRLLFYKTRENVFNRVIARQSRGVSKEEFKREILIMYPEDLDMKVS